MLGPCQAFVPRGGEGAWACPSSAVWPVGSPFPSLGPAVLQGSQELLVHVHLLRKPSLGH